MTTGYGNILTSKRHGVSFTFVKVTPSRASKHDLFLADFISISGAVTKENRFLWKARGSETVTVG